MAVKDPHQMIVTLDVRDLVSLIEAAVKRALAEKAPGKLQFDLQEGAWLLNVKPSLLRSRARSGEWPHHRAGRRFYFTQADLDQIDQITAIPSKKNGQKSS